MTENGDGVPPGGETAAARGNGEAGDSGFGMRQATEAVERLRGVIDQAAQAMRELSVASEEWAAARAHELAANVRVQGGYALGTVSRQVGDNPLTSLAMAFALGLACGYLMRR